MSHYFIHDSLFFQRQWMHWSLNILAEHISSDSGNVVSETVHYELFDVYKTCNMTEFARHHTPGYRPEMGYGHRLL